VKTMNKTVKAALVGAVFAWGVASFSIAQDNLPSFQYDAASFFADKDLSKVVEATRLAIENNWRMRITAPPEWRNRLMQAVEQAAGGQPISVDFTGTIIESVVINLSQKRSPNRATNRKKSRSDTNSGASAPVALPSAKVSRPVADKPSREGVFKENIEVPEMAGVGLDAPELPVSTSGAAEKKESGKEHSTAHREPGKKAVLEETAPAMTSPTALSGGNGPDQLTVTEGTKPAEETAAAATPVDGRQWLQDTYLGGQQVTRRLSLEKIRNDDRIMVKDDEFLLIRMSHGRRSAWWLKSPVNLGSEGLEQIAPDQYRVDNKMRLLKDSRAQSRLDSEEQNMSLASVNPAVEAERERLQKLYNKGRKIKKTLKPKNIHEDDIIIVGDGVKLLVRSERDGSLRRYWLTGDVNLDNTDVFRKESAIKYVALRKYTPDDAR